jgi:hypothetical protein
MSICFVEVGQTCFKKGILKKVLIFEIAIIIDFHFDSISIPIVLVGLLRRILADYRCGILRED